MKGPFPYYGASGIIDYISDYIFSYDTILISEDGENLNSRKTPIAFRATGKYWVNNHAHVLLPLKQHYFPIIINYLSAMDFSPYITGAVQPKLSQDNLLKITIEMPASEKEQRAIAAVLSSLDDKIDLLHRQNKTLEGITSALWRKMFIEDADPARKKRKLSDYGEFRNGINYSRNENGDTEYSILNVRDIVGCKFVEVDNLERVNINRGKATPYLLTEGDIVIVRSASPGESSIVLRDVPNVIYSGFSIRLRCHDKKHSFVLFHFLQSYKKEMDVFSDGTTLKNINQGVLSNIQLTIPREDALGQFNRRCTQVFDKILLNQQQISALSRLRDTLLPKLMSGEVRVRL
jgi:type I restriction enzyme S subunit